MKLKLEINIYADEFSAGKCFSQEFFVEQYSKGMLILKGGSSTFVYIVWKTIKNAFTINMFPLKSTFVCYLCYNFLHMNLFFYI